MMSFHGVPVHIARVDLVFFHKVGRQAGGLAGNDVTFF